MDEKTKKLCKLQLLGSPTAGTDPATRWNMLTSAPHGNTSNMRFFPHKYVTVTFNTSATPATLIVDGKPVNQLVNKHLAPHPT